MLTALLILIILLLLTGIFLFIFRFEVVPQNEKWVIVRNGKPHRIVGPGPVWHLEVFEEVRKKINLKEIPLATGGFHAFTKDKVRVDAEASFAIKVKDIEKALARTSNYEEWITGTAKGVAMSIIAEMEAEEVIKKRGLIKNKFLSALKAEAEPHGIAIIYGNVTKLEIPEPIRKKLEAKVVGAMNRAGQQKNAELVKYIKELDAEAQYFAAKRKADAERELMKVAGLALELIRENGGEVDPETLRDIVLGGKYMKALEAISKSDNSKLIFHSSDMQKVFANLMDMREKNKED